MKLTDYDWNGARVGDADRAAAPDMTGDGDGEWPDAISAFASGLPSPDLERLSHSAGVDAWSLTDNQIAEALLQLR